MYNKISLTLQIVKRGMPDEPSPESISGRKNGSAKCEPLASPVDTQPGYSGSDAAPGDALAFRWSSGSFRVGRSDPFENSVFLGAVHDIGKATVLFQSTITQRLPEARDRLARRCVLPDSFVYPRVTPHARASEAILLQLGCPKGIASIVGAHHGKPQENSSEYIDENIESYKNNYYGKGEKDLWFSL